MIKVNAKMSSAGFDAKMRAMQARKADAVCAGVSAIGAAAAARMIFLANQHRDTNRFAKSLEMAHNDLASLAGVPEIPLSTVKPSRRAAEIRERLEISVMRALRQEKRLKRWIDGNEKRADFKATWPSHRKLLRDYDKAGDITDRAIQALEAFDSASPGERASAIVVYGSKARRKNASRVALTTRNLDRVVIKQFGGAGAVAGCETGNGLASIASYEPHARIVDRRYRIGTRALAGIRKMGVRTFNRNYLARLGKESGVNPAKLTGLDRRSA